MGTASGMKLQFSDDFNTSCGPPDHFDMTRWTKWKGDVRAENGRGVLTTTGAGDDLVLMADIDDAPGDGAAHRGGHGDGGVDVGLGKAGQAHGGILSDRGHAVDGAADGVVAVYIGSHFKAP